MTPLFRRSPMRFAWPLLALVGCSAPDYSPVRDWAGTASLAVDRPRLAAPLPGAEASPAHDAARAMQTALATYLDAIATLAADGVLPHRENPFVALAARITPASATGGQAVTALGQQLRHATRNNAQAPMLRDEIRKADPQLQLLVAALVAAVIQAAPEEARARQEAANRYAATGAQSRDPAARQALREWARHRDHDFAERAAARARYAATLTELAAGHAMLAARASHLTREEVVLALRAAEGQLRRGAGG